MKSTTFRYLFETFIMLGFCCLEGSFFNGHIYSQSQLMSAIGGTDNDVAYSIVQTQDGGYVLGGTTTPTGTYDHKSYSVKINSMGSIQWSRIVDQRWSTSITQTANGGIALSGLTINSSSGICIMELDNSGTLQWSGLISSDGDSPTDIKRTLDGGYLITGSNSSESPRIYIAKVNTSRNLQWERIIAVGNVDQVNSITETNDGGCAVAGGTTPAFMTDYNMYIAKLDRTGNLQWSRTIGGSNNEYAISIISTIDGGYALAGITWSFGAGSSDMYIVKLNADGTLQWSKTIGGTNADHANSIIQTTDGGYVMAGGTSSFGAGNSDVYVVKLNESGTLLWSRTFGGAYYDFARSIIQTIDGGFAVAGFTNSFGNGSNDMYFVKLDANGNSCGYSTSPTSIINSSNSQISTTNSNITNTINGVSNPSASSSTGGTAMNVCLTGIEAGSNQIPDEFRLYQNYPNPFNPSTVIEYDIPVSTHAKLIVFDLNGREVMELVNEELQPGSYKIDFDGGSLSSGIYFYKLETDNYSLTMKMVLLK